MSGPTAADGLGREVPGEHIAHLSPREWGHITLTGVYRWDLDGPPAAVGGFRPLRGLLV